MLDNTAVHSEACPYKPMVDPEQTYFRDINKKGYILNITHNPRPIYEAPLNDKVWGQKVVTPTKTAGSHLFSGHFKFRRINWKILATFLGMSAKLRNVTI
jgi:hypothetical protein